MRQTRFKALFWIPYILTLASLAAPMFLQEMFFFGVPWFVWSLIFILIIWAVMLIIFATRDAFAEMPAPARYTPQHFLLLLWLSASALLLGIVWHNAFYALFWYAIPVFTGGDEAVFFTISLIVVPAGFVAGAVGRLWDWMVTGPATEMTKLGVKLPVRWYYFVPVGSYIWLWRFGRGVEALTGRKMRAAGVFAAVFFLGILGLAIVRRAAQHYPAAAPTR
jgi:hypothetical protein